MNYGIESTRKIWIRRMVYIRERICLLFDKSLKMKFDLINKWLD